MKHLKSLICLLLALLLLSGCAPAAPAQSDASTESAQTEEAAPAEQTEQAGPEAPAEEEATEPEADFITVTDHNDNVVQVPKNAQRIAVCDILPLPSVLCVFFDSAEKLVGIAPSSMSAAQNSLLSQLYPEILNAQTGYMNGTDVNTEELMQLAPDVVFYSASNPALGEKLTASGFCAIAVSANKWQYNCIETLNNWIDLLSQIFPENDRAALCRSYSKKIRPGMSAIITPSSVKAERDGSIRGIVTHVGTYILPVESIDRTFRNAAFAQYLLKECANMPVEVRILMSRDRNSPNGFRWTSGSGPDIRITAGTLCSASVVVEKDPPLELVFSGLRKFMFGRGVMEEFQLKNARTGAGGSAE